MALYEHHDLCLTPCVHSDIFVKTLLVVVLDPNTTTNNYISFYFCFDRIFLLLTIGFCVLRHYYKDTITDQFTYFLQHRYEIIFMSYLTIWLYIVVFPFMLWHLIHCITVYFLLSQLGAFNIRILNLPKWKKKIQKTT